MAHYTETTEFSPYNNIEEANALLVVDAGTGSITLQAKCGDNWITEEVFSADTTKRVSVGGGTWRVVVAGNAVFDWDV